MKPLFICYPKCSTCRKAEKWLIENNVEFEKRDIATDNPTATELSKWIDSSSIEPLKFFNSSGMKYRELNIKDNVKSLTTEEIISLLASDGMLVKRPLCVYKGGVLVGFKEELWKNAFL